MMFNLLTKPILFILTLGIAAQAFAADVVAETVVDSQPSVYEFALPQQSLAQSIADISRQTHQAVVYNPLLIEAFSADPLVGKFTVNAALQRLLRDKAFTVEPSQQGWIIKKQFNNNAIAVLNSQPESKSVETKAVEEVVVTGYYSQTLKAALLEKKQNAEITEVVIAEDIENFPAQNIAEALQHSPGVTVVRDRGEALFISIRGLPTNFNRVTLNGNSLAANENVRNSGQYGRRFHFDTFPAELVERVEVIKTSNAMQDEGAIGGIVNIKTFTPFALAKSQFSLSASLDESELAGNIKPRFSGLVNWLNNESNLGVAIAASISERSLRQDRALNFGWEKVAVEQASAAEFAEIITPGSFRPTLELEDRQRQGLTTSIEWKPNKELSIEWHSLLLAQKINYSEFSYGAGYNLNELLNNSSQFRNSALIGGETLTGSSQISRESSGVKDSNSSQDIDIHWQSNEWKFSANLSDSRAHSFNNDPIKRIRLHRENDIAFSFYYPQLDGKSVPSLYFNNISLLNPDDFYGRRLEWRIIDSRDHEQSIHINAHYTTSGEWVESIDAGVKVSVHERDYNRKDALIYDSVAGKHFSQDYFEGFPVSNFLGETNEQLPTEWLVPNQTLFWSLVDEASFYRSAPSQSDLLNSYGIREETAAYFLNANFIRQLAQYDWTGNLGLRLVHTQQTSNGYSLYNDLASPQRYESTYQKALWSANSVLHLTPNLYWRAAISSVMTRPDFQDLAPRLTLNSGEALTAVGGNPYLKPVTGNQFDSAIEWYFSDAGLLSAGVFSKTLTGFFQNQISEIPVNGKNYALSSIGNGANARVKGMEFSYQQKLTGLPSPFNALGVETNYTYTDSIAHYQTSTGVIRDDLADVAKHSVNLGGYYENHGLSLRLAYSWRDKVLNEVGTANMSALNTAAFGSLDMRLAYQLNADISLHIDAINLSNAAQQEYVSDQEFAGYTLYGRRFLLGVKWRVF